MAVIFAFYIAPGDWRDGLIRAATGYAESHVELLSVPEVKDTNLCLSASKRDGGKVRQKAITWKLGNWSFVKVPEIDGRDCATRILRHLGEPYDTLGAVLSVTPVSWCREGRWFCSELMAYGAGLHRPHRFTPGGFRQTILQMGGKAVGC